MQKFSKHFRKLITFFLLNKREPCMPANDIGRQIMGDTKLQRISRLPKLMMNLKKAILSVNLAMCNTKSLTMKIRELMNACQNEIELKKKSVCCFISLCCFLLSLTISFLFRDNPVTSVAIDLLLCQLWFRYKFFKALSKFTDDFSRICKCFHWCSNWEYWHQCSSEIRYLFY